MEGTVTAVDTTDNFIQKARSLFENILGERRLKLSEYYVKMPVEHHDLDRNPNLASGEPAIPILVEPFRFLTNFWPDDEFGARRTSAAEPGSLSVILGAYGNGKTELLYQLMLFAERHREAQEIPKILPISLSRCRGQLKHLAKAEPSWKDMAQVLFSDVADQKSSRVLTKIRDGVRQGQILLALDALDELAADPATHQNFFKGLRAFVIDSERPPRRHQFRIVVSMRLEYQSSIDPGLKELVETFDLGDVDSIRVHALLLDFFSRSQVAHYLHIRVHEKPELPAQVEENPTLLDILRRPLLLTLFAERANDKKSDPDLLANIDSPAKLIKAYVDAASEAMRTPQESLTPDYDWDDEALARESVRIYRAGNHTFLGESIKRFLRAARSDVPAPSQIEDDQAIKAVHKCPFLLLDDPSKESNHHGESEVEERPRVRFAHRGFFEYFVAQGLMLGVKAARGAATKDIDDLVLNVDTRKFLADLLKETGRYTFDKVSERSYGLAEKGRALWQERHAVDFDKLDDIRKSLLKAMTDPAHQGEDGVLSDDIEWFCRELEKHDFEYWHPGYLIYNLESVAVFIIYRRWKAEGRKLRKQVSPILRGILSWLLEFLTPDKQDKTPEESTRFNALRAEYERLIERILHIALRLRLDWVTVYPDWKNPQTGGDVKDLIEAKDTKQRAGKILGDIKGAIF